MKKWSIHGFDALRQGEFENGGQNLYVSRRGVLQRIWRFDINNDGYTDLFIANSHGYNEHPDTYIIHDPAGAARVQRVLTQGAQTGAVADLNGSGCDDLVIAATHDGQHIDLASYVYFGGRDGVTEDRKIELGAPACTCCAVGDFDGDGKKEIVYLIADGPDAASPVDLCNHRLRLYRQTARGFRVCDYRDFPTEVSYFTAADLDGDGCDDLYCRTADGRWLVLWGGPDGFSMERSTPILTATDDAARFDVLPFGGGNVRYAEFARPKVLRWNGKPHLFYADAESVRLLRLEGRRVAGAALTLRVPNVVSAAAGHIAGPDSQDLVLLQFSAPGPQKALVYFGSKGYTEPVRTLPVATPRDVLLCDFTGNGRDDVAVAQGRSETAFTTESLLYLTDRDGRIGETPRRFETHNCVEVFAADFCGDGKKSLVFINQQQSASYGHVPVYVYLNSKDGFSPARRLEFPGHSAGILMPIDFHDTGWPDLLVLHNAEDQPQLRPEGDLYLGGPAGFSADRRVKVPTPLAWGGHCADLNRDGYLDLIACCGSEVRVFLGGPDGFSAERMTVLHPAERPEDTALGMLWPALADLNGDGWLDLVVPISWQGYSRIYWGGPDGFSDARCTSIPVDYAVTVRVADLNRDGYPDLVFGTRASYHRNRYHEGSVTIFWGGPAGYSGYNCCVLPSYQSNCITIADLNNDGWLDIFASSYFNKRERDIPSFLYWNDRGHFSLTNRQRLFSHSSSAAWACDFNEDGYVDLCVTNHRAYGNHNTESAIWWNGPNGFCEERRTWLPTIGPHAMVPNDVGNVMTRGPEEHYTAPAAEAEGLRCIGWTGDIPEKTWVGCQIRTAADPAALAQAAFVGPDGTGDSRFAWEEAIPAALIHGRFFQVRLFLGAVNSGNTPRITEIYAK